MQSKLSRLEGQVRSNRFRRQKPLLFTQTLMIFRFHVRTLHVVLPWEGQGKSHPARSAQSPKKTSRDLKNKATFKPPWMVQNWYFPSCFFTQTFWSRPYPLPALAHISVAYLRKWHSIRFSRVGDLHLPFWGHSCWKCSFTILGGLRSIKIHPRVGRLGGLVG